MIMKSIKGKVFWITGASSGIGKSLAELVMLQDAKVVLSGRNKQALNAVAEQFEKSENVMILPFDLAKIDDANMLVEKIIAKFGRIDFLINNGGISQRS